MAVVRRFRGTASLLRRNNEQLWPLAWKPWEDRFLKIMETKQTETCHTDWHFKEQKDTKAPGNVSNSNGYYTDHLLYPLSISEFFQNVYLCPPRGSENRLETVAKNALTFWHRNLTFKF
jgi:hypothetical protein